MGEVRLHWKDKRDHASGLLIISMCYVFYKWWDTFDQRNVKESHDNGIICINYKKKCGLKVKSLMFSQNIATKCFLTQMCCMGIGGLY
jgi:hypothetical protein